MRVALGASNFTSLQADGAGSLTLLAGILLLIPGFITDAAALLLLVAPLRRALAAALRRGPPRADGVVDLEPEQWHQVPDPALPKRGRGRKRRSAITAASLFACGCYVSHAPRPAPAARRSVHVDDQWRPGRSARRKTRQPQLNVVAQYIKDLSFENPNAPRSMAMGQQPQINIQINVNAKPLSDTDIEVTLKLDGKAEAKDNLMFGFELEYAGVFRVQNVPPDAMNAVVLIECPRLLFPFAREIVANTVRNGGFPPLLLDPVDFVALYRQRMAETQPGAAPTA